MSGYWMAAIVSLWLLLVAVAVAQLGLLRRVAPLLDGHDHRTLDIGGIAVGAIPGPFEALTTDGRTVGLEVLRGRPTVVLLTSVGCLPCEQLAAQLRHADIDDLPTDLVVIAADRDDIAALGLPPTVTVLRQVGRSVSAAFGSDGTPHAFALDENCVVRANTVPATIADLVGLAAACNVSNTLNSLPHKQLN